MLQPLQILIRRGRFKVTIPHPVIIDEGKRRRPNVFFIGRAVGIGAFEQQPDKLPHGIKGKPRKPHFAVRREVGEVQFVTIALIVSLLQTRSEEFCLGQFLHIEDEWI